MPPTKTPPESPAPASGLPRATPHALVGQGVAAIDTPALVIDLDAMQRNLECMAAFARTHGLRWRPHAKMHKSAELASRLVAGGAVGACVQKTSEAEALAAGGVSDIYISNEVIAPAKLMRVAVLARTLAARGGRLAIAVDSLAGVSALAQAMQQAGGAMIDVFVEVDVGQGRCGVPPGSAAVALAQEILRHPLALRFAGLQAYHGRAQHLRSVRERTEAITAAARHAAVTRDALAAAGIAVPLITGAGTGTMACEAAAGLWGELQTGSFLFMDADYAANEADPRQPAFEHALFVKTQVISVSADHAVCDAGHKSHAIDSGLPRVWTPEPGQALEYGNGGDEHGVLRPAAGSTWLPALGETLWLIPGHCDPTVNLYDWMIGVAGGLQSGTVERVIRVDARGALS